MIVNVSRADTAGDSTMVLTNDATMTKRLIVYRQYFDRTFYAAIRQSTNIITHDATNTITSGDSAVGKDNVLYNTIDANLAKDTLSSCGSVDSDAADGVVVAIEGTIKVICAIMADGGVVADGGAEAGGAVGDVITQLEELVLVSIASVHIGCQQVELGGI